jgi:uncharacterized protein YjiS (DUF1127 family)
MLSIRNIRFTDTRGARIPWLVPKRRTEVHSSKAQEIAMTAPAPAPLTTATAAPARARKAFRVVVLAQAVATMWTTWRRRREVGNLLQMDDWMLRDIGLSRGDVHDAMADRLTFDPSSRLASTAARHIAAERSRMRDSLRRAEALNAAKPASPLSRAA